MNKETKYRQTKDELKSYLKEQIEFFKKV